MVSQVGTEPAPWALLSYRLPREPSTPRIAVWRRLKALGVEQIGDGLVALPDAPNTREQLEWISADVIEAGGEAVVWVATTATANDDSLRTRLRAARNAEYRELIDEAATLTQPVDRRTLQRLRRELRRIERRDHLRADEREHARLAIDALASESTEVMS